MSSSFSDLVSRYLDAELSDPEHQLLQEQLRSSATRRNEFAAAVLLHDRLHGELASQLTEASTVQTARPPSRTWLRRMIGLAGITSVVCMLGVVLWLGMGETPVSAATELNRLIAVQLQAMDRTYRMTVEEVAAPRRHQGEGEHAGRPPKAPLDDALLHVRHGAQFVLQRRTAEGESFVTGSDGQVSWAVRPDGSVKMSRDLMHFSRDVPGHEHGLPLMQIDEGLEQLRAAYDVELLPIESDETQSSETTRLMVAVRKRGQRGPQRVEISYAVASGQILQMRFVEMPYGPERLTLRMTLVEERDLGPNFFHHESHHDATRTVEEE